MHKFERALSWIVKIGLWLIPLLPLIISSTMLFPFITGKNFAFRAIVEIIFACWIGLAVLKSEYRPRLTPLFKIITIFTSIVLIADILSPNPYRSILSNYERMEGFMMIGHLYLYFIMLASMFRTRRDWMVFFHVSLAASIAASFVGLLQRLGLRPSLQGGFRVDSTIGNPTYFAAYLLFHVWLLALLAYQYRATLWRAAVYAVLLVAELIMIYFTATRGVVVALVVVLIPVAALLVIFWDRIRGERRRAWSRGRIAAACGLALIVLVPLIFWSIRGSDFVQSSQALRRLTNYSLGEGTVQDRMMIWGMSLKGILERPILGWGQENYYLVFQKYFNPGLYGAEQWFDRSHNVLLDWAVHTGIVGLAAYLGIFVVFFMSLIRMMRRERRLFLPGLLLIGLFASYFLQNLFVFDNLNSYLLFFAFLAYGAFLGEGHKEEKADARPSARNPRREARAGAAALGAIIVAGVWGYFTIARPMQESKALIRALAITQSHPTIPQAQAAFAAALQYRTFGDTEVHEQLGGVARDIAGSETGTPDERKRFTEFALDELGREISRPAKDVKHMLFVETIMDRALVLDTRYAAPAEAIGREAITLAPNKQPVYFELAQLYLTLNRLNDALTVLQQAWRLDKSFRSAAANLWMIAIFDKKPAVIDEIRQASTLQDLGEANIVNIAGAYRQVKDFASARDIYAALVTMAPKNAQYHATYAALLATTGDRAAARKEVEEAMRADPSFVNEGKQFLQQLQ